MNPPGWYGGAALAALVSAGLGATGTSEGEPVPLPPAATAVNAPECTGDSFANGDALSRLVSEANTMASDHSIELRPGCIYTVRDTLVVKARPYGGGGLPLSISGVEAIVEHPPLSAEPDVRAKGGQAPFRVFDVEAGAQLNLSGLEVRGGRARSDDGGGGGIRVGSGAILRLDRVTLRGNRSPDLGAALANYGFAALQDVTISANRSGAGGSIVHNAARLRVAGTTVSGNRGDGGATLRNTGQAEVVRSTFSANAGQARVVENTFRLRVGASTVADNDGAGILDRQDAVVFSSLLAGNTGPACAGDRIPFDRSLATDASCNGVISSVTLGSLRHNGGVTRTMALRHGSSGVDPGECPLSSGYTASDLVQDQRGVTRDDKCDIGAFERIDEDGDGYDDLTEMP